MSEEVPPSKKLCKELDEAILRFNKAIELDPNYHEAYQTKGIKIKN